MANLDEAQQLLGFAVWECEAGGDVVIGTPPLREIFGTLPATLGALIASVHEHERARFAAAVAAGAPFALEHRIVRPDGGIRIVETRAAPFGTRFVAAVEDVTGREDHLGELMFADRMQALATFARGLAHEINNPLAFVQLNLDAVRQEICAPRSPDRAAELEAMLREAREGLQRIQNIVRGISLFARRSEEHHGAVALDRVLERALETMSVELAQRARVVRAYGDAPAVRANEARLVQVFVNILQNAIAAIPEGAAALHEIRVTTRGETGRAIVEIADTGHGMLPGQCAHALDPFYTTRAVGDGIGLGLSICYGIVRSLGGEITLESALGRGSVVRVMLPAATEVTARPPAARARPVAGALRRGRVLIVDDEVAFATSLRRLIARDHEVFMMSRGREALHDIQAGARYDAILCDLTMPEMTGMELHARLGELAPEQADRMIFVTGGAFTAAAQEFLEGLKTPWFEKPCDVGELKAAVAALVG